MTYSLHHHTCLKYYSCLWVAQCVYQAWSFSVHCLAFQEISHTILVYIKESFLWILFLLGDTRALEASPMIRDFQQTTVLLWPIWDLANCVTVSPRPSPCSQAWATAAWPTTELCHYRQRHRPPPLLLLLTDRCRHLPPRTPAPPRKLSRTSVGRGQMSSPLRVKLVNIV